LQDKFEGYKLPSSASSSWQGLDFGRWTTTLRLMPVKTEQEYTPEEIKHWESRAPGWKIRCLKCGFTEPFGKYGIRKAAVGKSYNLGFCGQCHWLWFFVIEKGNDA
jgi:hypothetical protein